MNFRLLWALLKKQKFLSKKEETRIVEAIKKAETGNRGEVRLYVESSSGARDALERAQEIFFYLKMDRTVHGTGVLLYLALKDRKAAVFAGPGIHGKASPGFWKDAIDAVTMGFSENNPAGGLFLALDRIGSLLRESVPGEDISGNEIPDSISRE